MAGDDELASDMERLGYFAAEVFAETEAADHPAVSQFRSLLPKGVPINPSKVRAWLKRHGAKPGEGLKRAAAQEFRGIDSNGKLNPRLEPRSPELETVWLEVVVVLRENFGRERMRFSRVEFQPESPAGHLAGAAQALHDRFGWEAGSAAGWLLCGSPPDPPAIVVTPKTASTVIEAPIWIPLNLVGRLISGAAAHDLIAKRGPRLGHKLLEVMVFSIRRNDGRSWARVLEEWNKAAPAEWRYRGDDSRRHFARDARDTYRKLMSKPFDWNRGGIDAEA